MKKHRQRQKKHSKIKAQRIHAENRFFLRYGIELTRALRKEFVKMIQNGKAQLREEQSNRVRIYSITHNGNDIKVVYDKIRKTIVTCLSKEDSLNT